MQETPEQKKQHFSTVQLTLQRECPESIQHSFLGAICCCGKRDTTVKRIYQGCRKAGAQLSSPKDDRAHVHPGPVGASTSIHKVRHLKVENCMLLPCQRKGQARKSPEQLWQPLASTQHKGTRCLYPHALQGQCNHTP